jgi:hypothetical protein
MSPVIVVHCLFRGSIRQRFGRIAAQAAESRVNRAAIFSLHTCILGID